MKKTLLLLCSVTISMVAFSQLRNQSTPTYSVSESTTNTISQSTQTQSYQSNWIPQLGKTPVSGQVKTPCVDTLLFEDFETETIPVTWINLDLDGATDANARPLNWFPMQDLQNINGTDTNDVAASSSWFSPFGQANNWMILDAVNPCIDTKLNWWSAPFEGPTFMDGYKILVSTTGTNIGDFTDTIFVHAESLNGTATPTAGNIHSDYNGNNGVLQEWTVDLGMYDNQTIYVAYVHDSNDDNLILIDNIFIGILQAHDLSVIGTNQTPHYYSTPLTQVQGLTFEGEVELNNISDVTQPVLGIEVFQNITSVFTNSPSQATQLAGAIDTYTASSTYTPSAIDSFTVTYNVSAIEVDPDLTNNVDTSYFVVSDSVYATENGTFDGALSIGAGNAGFLGNAYEAVVADDLTGITFFLTSPTVGDTIVGQVYDMVGGVPNQLIASTDTLFVASTSPAEYTLQIIGGSVNLAVGTYAVGIWEPISSSSTIATTTEYYEPGTSWVYFTGAWNNIEFYSFFSTYYARANFGPVCNDPVSSFTTAPAGLIVDFTDASTTTGTASWAWDFGDGNTSTQQNPMHTYAMAGTYTVCLIVNDNCGADTVCMPITVSCSGPVASFGESILGYDVTFTDGSTTTGTATWLWDFGDGNTSTLQNPTHTYAAVGTYTVCLIVNDNCGADTLCAPITVTCTGPTASFGETIAGYDATFTDGSTITGTATWLWDFGDGNTSTQQNPVHTYLAAGSYTACLTVTDDCGTDSTCTTINISDAGIEEGELDYVSIFPMPANDYIMVGNLYADQNYVVELVNGLGQLIGQYTVQHSTEFKIELADIAHGAYQLRIKSTNGIGVKPILIVRQ